MFKDFLLRKMLKSQLKGVPEDQQEKMITMIKENPQLFQKIATEVQTRIKSGKDQMTAVKEVLEIYKDELGKIDGLKEALM